MNCPYKLNSLNLLRIEKESDHIFLSHNDDGVGAIHIFDPGICGDIREPPDHLGRMHTRLIGKLSPNSLGI